MEESAYIGSAFAGFAYLVVGIRLLRLGARTRSNAERLIGLTFLIWSLSYVFWVFAILLRGQPTLESQFIIASRLSTNLGGIGIAFFPLFAFSRVSTWAKWMVTVTVVCPDLVATPMMEHQLDFDASALAFSGSRPLTVEERNKTVDVAMEVAKGKVPIVAATGSQSFAETEALTAHADKAGADAMLIVTPYYIRPPQRGLAKYYIEMAKRTDKPWMIYHIPGRTAINVTLDSMQQIRDKSSTFIGMKHAVNDLGFVSECFAALGNDFKVFVGLEELSFPEMAIGACGKGDKAK